MQRNFMIFRDSDSALSTSDRCPYMARRRGGVFVTNVSCRDIKWRAAADDTDEVFPFLQDMTDVLGDQRGEHIHTEFIFGREDEIDSKVSPG